MRARVLHSVLVTLEWRLLAFAITNLFLWATTGELWQATVMALGLHGILLVVHFVWYFFRFGQYRSAETAASVSE